MLFEKTFDFVAMVFIACVSKVLFPVFMYTSSLRNGEVPDVEVILLNELFLWAVCSRSGNRRDMAELFQNLDIFLSQSISVGSRDSAKKAEIRRPLPESVQ